MVKVFYVSLLFVLLLACGQAEDKKNSDKKDTAGKNAANEGEAVIQTAKDAYIYGLPLVILDITRRQMTNPATAGTMYAPVNQFKHNSFFPDASFTSVVRPNADTYYSTAMLDLTAEPIILSVPNTHGRYYMMPMLDAYTNVFASPGSRTTGTEAANFLIAGPQWKGAVPQGMKQINAPTNSVWIIGRTQVNSKEDGDKVVVPLQRQYKLTPLSGWGKSYTPPKPNADEKSPKGDPNSIVRGMPVDEYFNYLNQLLAKNPPPAADKEAIDRFASIGVAAGNKFSLDAIPSPERATLNSVPKEVFDAFDKQKNTPSNSGTGWTLTGSNVGAYGTDYLTRGYISYFGLGANIREDAIYPNTNVDADGNALNGVNKYVMHFDKGQTPPANAFWSLTMYGPEGYFVANPLNRYTLGDRSKLKSNADGSLDIYIQNVPPGKDKETNWLPSPSGPFNLLLRVYWPKEEMINGSWQTPPVKKV